MILGGVKFFEPSKCLAVNGAFGAASNGGAAADYCLDRNPYTYWYTTGSNDSITETLTIDFGSPQVIDRLFLILHNFKHFKVQYYLSGVITDFTNVLGIDGGLSGIAQTNFADDSAYYEFDSVTTQKVVVTIYSTQITNADKFLSQLVVTTEIGTLIGFPVISDISIDRNLKARKTLSGRSSVLKGDENAAFSLQFKSYPSALTYNVDIDLAMELNDRDDPFLVWLCGGRRGTRYFRYTLRGYRLQDLYLMTITKPYKLGYTQSVYVNSLNAQIDLEESINGSAN